MLMQLGVDLGLSDILWFVSDISRIVSDIRLTLSDIFSYMSDNLKNTLVWSCRWVAGTGPSSQVTKDPVGMKIIPCRK